MHRPVHRFLIVQLVLLCSVLLGGCSPQAKNARHLARAGKYREKQQYREALLEYMNVLRENPTNRVAIRETGLTFFDMGDSRAAFPYLQQADASNPSDTETSWKLGAVYLSRGDRVQARKKAAGVLSRHPDHLEAIMLWAGTAASSNEIDEAIGSLKKASARLKDQPRLYLALGAMHVQREDYAAAEEVYQAALKQDAKAWKPHLALGDLYLLKRDSVRAEQEYRMAADFSPQDSVARIRFARFLWASRKPKEAREILEDVTRKSPESVPAWFQLAEFAFSERDFDLCNDILNRILKQSPSHIDAFLLLQRVKLAQGKVDEAIVEYGRLVAAFPKVAQGRFFLGMAYLQKGDVSKATAELEKSVELNPEFMDAFRVLSELQIRTGNADGALNLLNKLIRRHPDAGFAHVLIGEAHSSRKDFSKAAEAYRKLINLTPNNPQGFFLLGLALQRQGKIAEAVAMYESSLKLHPGFVEALDRLAILELERTGKWDASLIRIRRQIEIAPDQAGLRYLLGLAYLRMSEWDEAEKALLKAVELQPDLTAAYVALSQVYVVRNKDNEALERIDKALSVNSNDVASLMMKGTLLERKNDFAAAAQQYQLVLRSNPRHAQAANNLAYLYAEDQDKKEKAFELAKLARELAPKDPAIADTLGWIVYRRGDFKWALTLLQESADQLLGHPEVLYHLGMSQSAFGNDEAAREALAEALKSNQEFKGRDEAKELLAVLDMNPDMPGSSAQGKIEAFLAKYPDSSLAWVRLGAIQEKGENFAAAQRSYERALAPNPRYLPGLLRLAGLYSSHFGDSEKALALAKQARDSFPDDPRVADVLAWIAFKRGDHKWAHGLLAESIRKLPDDPSIQYHYGMVNFALGRIDVATNLIRKALNAPVGIQEGQEAYKLLKALERPDVTGDDGVDNGSTGALSPAMLPVLLSSASAALKAGDPQGAQKRYERIVSFYPEFTPAIKGLVLLYGEQKVVTEQSFKLAAKARELMPQDACVAEVLGKMAFKRGQYAYARGLLMESAEKLTTNSDILYYLGMCHYQLQDKASAKKALLRSLELDPKADWAPSAKATLSQLK
jgi:tetratricopeptide (TPR) repeat protein